MAEWLHQAAETGVYLFAIIGFAWGILYVLGQISELLLLFTKAGKQLMVTVDHYKNCPHK